jgi:hypothetical protein
MLIHMLQFQKKRYKETPTPKKNKLKIKNINNQMNALHTFQSKRKSDNVHERASLKILI